jgi:hypothetical protein
MNWARWERLEPLTGIVAAVLWVVGVWVVEGPGNQPDSDASAAAILAFFKDEVGAIFLGAFLFGLGALFFLWFLGSLRAVLGTAEGGARRLTGIAYAGGLATGICLLLLPGGTTAGAINEQNLTPEAAQALLTMFNAFYFGAELACAVFLFAVALIIFRFGALPVWLGWSSAVLALWLVILPVGWIAMAIGFPLWVVAVAWLLYARAGAAPAAAEPGAPPPVA